jgi:hypothetical protein
MFSHVFKAVQFFITSENTNLLAASHPKRPAATTSKGRYFSLGGHLRLGASCFQLNVLFEVQLHFIVAFFINMI